MGHFEIGMTLVVVPAGVGGEGQLDVGSFAQCVLGSIGSANLHVELVATIAGADDNGLAYEAAKGFEDFLAELLEDRYILRWHSVIDTVFLSSL